MNKFYAMALFSLVCLAGCETETTPIKTGYPRTDPATVRVYDRYPKMGPILTLGPVSSRGPPPPRGGAGRPLVRTRENTPDFLPAISAIRPERWAADAIILKEKDVVISAGSVRHRWQRSGRCWRIRLAGIAIKVARLRNM